MSGVSSEVECKACWKRPRNAVRLGGSICWSHSHVPLVTFHVPRTCIVDSGFITFQTSAFIFFRAVSPTQPQDVKSTELSVRCTAQYTELINVRRHVNDIGHLCAGINLSPCQLQYAYRPIQNTLTATCRSSGLW